MGARRWRSLIPVLALWAVSTNADDSYSVKCWRVETSSSSIVTITRTAVDDACPVGVTLADLSAPFAPGDDVPAIWSVTLKNSLDTSNTIGMPFPPSPTSIGSGIAPAQFSTYIRSCASIASCDPTTTAVTSSSVTSSNFSAVGAALSFSTIRGTKFTETGIYPVGAFVAVRDAVSPSVTYVFAAYANVTIRAKTLSTVPPTDGVVRCRLSRQSPLSATLDPNASVSVSSNCELRVALAPIAVVRPNTAVSVGWTATLAPRADADIHLPSPLPSVQVDPPAGNAYEIVATYVKLCKSDASCDEYTTADALDALVSAGPASFSSSGNVSFSSPPVLLATAGRHTAMIHMVVAGPARRYDFVYYFKLIATVDDVAKEVAATTYTPDATTSYCWNVLADATRTDANATNVAAMATATACPYTSTLSIPTTSPTANSLFSINWSIATNTNYSALTSPLATDVIFSTVYDPTAKTNFSLPTLDVYTCGKGTTACTPFSTDKTLLVSLPSQNLDNGQVTIPISNITFLSEGNYTLMAYSIIPNGASQIDTAVYTTLSITISAPMVPTPVQSTTKGKSHTVVYVVVPIVCVVVVVAAVLGAVWLRRRQQEQRMEKMVQFGMFSAPSGLQGTMIHTAESRGSFHSGDSRESFSFLRVQASQPSPMIETPREGSLSYDPYQRPSFQEMSVPESSLSFAFTENERPSTLTDDGHHKVYDV